MLALKSSRRAHRSPTHHFKATSRFHACMHWWTRDWKCVLTWPMPSDIYLMALKAQASNTEIWTMGHSRSLDRSKLIMWLWNVSKKSIKCHGRSVQRVDESESWAQKQQEEGILNKHSIEQLFWTKNRNKTINLIEWLENINFVSPRKEKKKRLRQSKSQWKIYYKVDTEGTMSNIINMLTRNSTVHSRINISNARIFWQAILRIHLIMFLKCHNNFHVCWPFKILVVYKGFYSNRKF